VYNHFAAIGFRVETKEDVAPLAERASPDSESFPVTSGRYMRWTGDGAELWLQINSRNQLIGINPHFGGESRTQVRIVERVKHPHDTPLDGAFYAWASPETDASDSGAYPFVFDAPDAALYSDLELPCTAEAQVAAFAHEVSFFDSEQAYEASQARAGFKFSSRYFIPSGTFAASGELAGVPRAEAVFAGQVIQSARRMNPLSRIPFYWALVDTYGGRYDVVIDTTLLATQPVIGGFLSGSFWLSGRLVSRPKRTRGWLGKLIGGAR